MILAVMIRGLIELSRLRNQEVPYMDTSGASLSEASTMVRLEQPQPRFTPWDATLHFISTGPRHGRFQGLVLEVTFRIRYRCSKVFHTLHVG